MIIDNDANSLTTSRKNELQAMLESLIAVSEIGFSVDSEPPSGLSPIENMKYVGLIRSRAAKSEGLSLKCISDILAAVK
jgi:hypothetical protein